MSSSIQPPRPPAPPPRSSSNVVPIVLAVLALIVLVSVMTVWIGLRFLSRAVQVHVRDGAGDKKEVSIKVPFASIEARHDVNEASLGLPLYPGATRFNDKDSATVNMQFGGDQGVRILVGKFETPDPIDKVRDFYQKRLGTEVTKFTQRDHEGKTVFEIKRHDLEKVVALKDQGNGTRIELVRVEHGHTETN